MKLKTFKIVRQKKNEVELPDWFKLPSEFSKEWNENGELVVNTTDQLHLLPENIIVAEIGVQFGNYSEKILEIVKPSKLYLVEMDEEHCIELRKKFSKYIEEGTVEVINESSLVAHERFTEEYFDCIHIDADHSYEAVNKDLENFHKKIKDGGSMVVFVGESIK
jgi:phospholipid N-methyltransferase